MSTENSISIEIPEADVQAVNDALNTINTILEPHLKPLTVDQRKTLPKVSDGTLPFVNKAMAYAESHPQFAPPFLNVPEMKKDLEVVKALTPLMNVVGHLHSLLDDTIMRAGSEAYVAGLSYYQGVKLATRMNVSNAKSIYDDLKKRFENQGPQGSE